MRVKFTAGSATGGANVYQKGEIVDLPPDQAMRHLDSGAAIPAPDEDEEVHTALEPMHHVKKAIKKRS